ncbi:MAG TPA: hypothetical protein VKH64_17455 [Candidatus Binatia bacterium]|nr:hypothetical protein [Candidatus Binatia bacterium]
MEIILLAVACVVFGALYLLATPVGMVLGAICFVISELVLLVGRLGQLAAQGMHRALKNRRLDSPLHLRLFK